MKRVYEAGVAFAIIAIILFLSLSAISNPVDGQKSQAQKGEFNSRSLQAQNNIDSPLQEECVEGQVQSCILDNGCKGEMVCIYSSWSECRPKRACTPGEKVPCALTGCTFALKECNSCGDGWGECSPAFEN